MAFRRPTADPVLAPCITCHAWNGDRSMIAVSPNNSSILVYKTNGSEDLDKWTLLHELQEHDHLVTAIDWAPNTNRILSCSQDRNAYVWNFDEQADEWKPTLVLLRINRAATCCKWSPNEDKFAVGSGARLVAVCYFEEENNWWVAKMIKKPIRSTVLNVAWHPTDNTLLAVTSSDFRCRIFSTWLKNIDPRDARKAKFGEMISEYSARGWIHDAAFSPSGNRFAFVSHDSGVTVVDRSGDADNIETIYGTDLPFRSLFFSSENSIIAAGHDFTPVAFSFSGGEWKLNGKVDVGGGEKKAVAGGVRSAFMKFQTAGTTGNSASTDRAPKTKHKNMIREVRPFAVDSSGNATKFTTCSLDGRVLFWDMKDVQAKCEGFTL